MFRALVLVNHGEPIIRELELSDLPEGEVLVAVGYSSLNYKDGLAVSGRGKIVRGEYPFVPGIDLAGRVVRSASLDFDEGDPVLATGWGLGEERWGGYAQRQRLPSHMLEPLPQQLAPRDAMVLGTAGLTAMLSVMALEEHGATPGGGEVVVTGASGGVGSIAVALLSRIGFDVVASTGSEDAHTYLKNLGASRIIPRDELGHGPRRPLDSAAWSGAVDTVGGATLAALLSRMRLHGSVAACGLASGHELETTVFPFILRGVNLLGIDSNRCPSAKRRRAWRRLAEALPGDVLESLTAAEIGLEEVPAWSERILAGGVRGRVVVAL